MPLNTSNPNSDEQFHEILSPSPCVLLLNGFPGVGKLTIARAIETKPKLENKPSRLIDNHLLIDPVVAIEPVRNAAHCALRESFRKAACEGLKTSNEEKLVIIFTTALSISDLATPYNDIGQLAQYVDLADARGVPLVIVNILCDLGTNSGRLCSEGRKEVGGKTKLVDIDVLERVRRETSLLDREQAMACRKGGSVFHFELDTSGLSVEEATQRVFGLLCKVVAERQV